MDEKTRHRQPDVAESQKGAGESLRTNFRELIQELLARRRSPGKMVFSTGLGQLPIVGNVVSAVEGGWELLKEQRSWIAYCAKVRVIVSLTGCDDGGNGAGQEQPEELEAFT